MIIRYLRYRFKAQGKYRLHSPLVFGLYEKVLEKTKFSKKNYDNDFFDTLDKNLKAFIDDNPLIFNEKDCMMVVRDIHRNRKNEADWETLKNEKKVKLSVDCWKFGMIFVMNRMRKEHYILKV